MTSDLTQTLVEFTKELGGDLVGVASATRISEIAAQVRPYFEGQELFIAHDRSKHYYPWEPEIETQSRAVMTTEDWLPGAKSVLVFGLRMHEVVLKYATRQSGRTLFRPTLLIGSVRPSACVS